MWLVPKVDQWAMSIKFSVKSRNAGGRSPLAARAWRLFQGRRAVSVGGVVVPSLAGTHQKDRWDEQVRSKYLEIIP